MSHSSGLPHEESTKEAEPTIIDPPSLRAPASFDVSV